jgi:hypothetical protein
VLAALERGEPIRILVCASTYTAVDNVLLSLNEQLEAAAGQRDVVVARLRSYSRGRDADVPEAIDVELNPREPSEAARALRERLEANAGVTVVGSTPMQVYNLLTLDDSGPQHEMFDVILFDEATQTDVAHATLALAGLAAGGAVVVAGDPLQLPPIAPAEPPQRLQAFVGSFYSFLRDVHGLEQEMLEENYRSNRAIVAFSRRAGYGDALTSYSPELALTLEPASGRPADWPETFAWYPEYEQFVDPAQPAVCFVYPDTRASQWNRFEADTVAALALLLRKRLHADLSGEIGADGIARTPSVALHTDQSFWERGVGIVTPHRAQQGLIISRLQHVFDAAGTEVAAIRRAVDTVERFQGQQRDVIIASFALGDPDAIRDEEEFLLSLNRFNVMASRARAKLITLVSRDVVDHLPNDIEIVRDSRLLKVYVDSFCNQAQTITLGYQDEDDLHPYEGQFRWHE